MKEQTHSRERKLGKQLRTIREAEPQGHTVACIQKGQITGSDHRCGRPAGQKSSKEVDRLPAQHDTNTNQASYMHFGTRIFGHGNHGARNSGAQLLD